MNAGNAPGRKNKISPGMKKLLNGVPCKKEIGTWMFPPFGEAITLTPPKIEIILWDPIIAVSR
jgi:cytochrome c-type biogenesis protein CcmH/NrfF